jgi:hypothetical protein
MTFDLFLVFGPHALAQFLDDAAIRKAIIRRYFFGVYQAEMNAIYALLAG